MLDCRARNLSTSTIDRAYYPCLRDLAEFLDDPEAADVRPIHLRRFVVDLQRSTKFSRGEHPWMEETDIPISAWTVHRYVRVIKTLFTWSYREKLLPSNPAATLALPELPKRGRMEVFSKEEVKLVLEAAKEMSYRNYVIVFLLLDSGIRRKELTDLTIDDVNVGTGQIHIREGKGRKERRVRVGNACRRVLWHYLVEYRKPKHDRVKAFLLSKRGTALTYEAVGSLFRHMSEKTGLRIFAHKFRHTFATIFARKTPNAILLADALGHEDLGMARWYVHLAGTESTDDNSPMDFLLGDDF